MHDVTHDAHGARLSEQGGDGAKTTTRGNNELNEIYRVPEDPAVLCGTKYNVTTKAIFIHIS